MSDAESAAIAALREAVRALSIGETTVHHAVPEASREPDLTIEVAHLMEVTARLLRATDLDAVPRSGTNHRLHAVAQHLDAGAQLARRADGEQTARGSDMPEPRRPAR